MNIAICDDDQKTLDEISGIIEDYMIDRSMNVGYSTFLNYDEIIGRIDEFDVFLLDYDMPGINGLDFSKMVYQQFGENKAIIFITAYDDVVYRAFEVRAWRYILKPIRDSDIYEALDSYASSNANQKRFVIMQNGENVVINVGEMDCICADGKLSVINMTDGRMIESRETMDSLESRLTDLGCFRIHRKYIINLKQVSSYMNNYVMLKSGKSLDMSPRRYNSFRLAYLRMGE